jgi:hypothetical protein
VELRCVEKRADTHIVSLALFDVWPFMHVLYALLFIFAHRRTHTHAHQLAIYTYMHTHTHRREVTVAKAAQRAVRGRALQTNGNTGNTGITEHETDKPLTAEADKPRGGVRVFKRGKWHDETPVANEILLRDVSSTVCILVVCMPRLLVCGL